MSSFPDAGSLVKPLVEVITSDTSTILQEQLVHIAAEQAVLKTLNHAMHQSLGNQVDVCCGASI